MIKAKGLTKRYRELVAVDALDFCIGLGECFGFLGPNGAGKTSIIKMINCTSPVTAGQLIVDGKDVAHHQRAIKSALGVVSQADSLDPDLSVLQNLLAYGRYFNLPKSLVQRQVRESLALFQLEEKAHQKPDELSGRYEKAIINSQGPNPLAPNSPVGRAYYWIGSPESSFGLGEAPVFENYWHHHFAHYPLHGRGFVSLRPASGYGPGQDFGRRCT